MAKKNFKNVESLQTVVNVINEADLALSNPKHNINTSSISELLSGALGAGAGIGISYAALYGLGTTGLSAAGITSGLATAGLGGGMVAGVAVLAIPAAVLAAGGVALAHWRNAKKLNDKKALLYEECIAKQNAINAALAKERRRDKARIDELTALNILLQKAIEELRADLGKTA